MRGRPGQESSGQGSQINGSGRPPQGAPSRSQAASARAIGEPGEAAAARERLVAAMERVIARRGYEACTVGEVAAEAGASPASFQLHFAGKGECFVAVHEAIVDRALETAWHSCPANRPWPERAIAGLEAVVGICVERPRLAGAALVEVKRAGAAGWRAYLDSLARFAELVEPDAEAARDLPEKAPLIAVSGVAGILGEELQRGEEARLRELLPELGLALLLPLIGPLAAGEEMARLGVEAAG